MTAKTFRDRLQACPFAPFRIVMRSGEKYDVYRSEWAFVTTTSILVGIGVYADEVLDDFETCSLSNVTAIEPLSVATADTN